MALYSQDIGHDAFELTAHDTNAQPANRGGFVAADGDVVLINRAGETLPTMTLAAGTYIPWAIHILHTDSTATVLGVK